MEIKDLNTFLNYYTKVKQRTKKLFPYIPEDKIEWTFQPGKFTIGDLIRHLATIEKVYVWRKCTRQTQRL